ncbi:MAG: hypothetical protein ACXQS8_06880 [Candidatus Helarchaeales archaeon]
MVFKNGELLRTYYYRVSLDDLIDRTRLEFHFSDFVDKNDENPDASSPLNMGGGENYEFHEMDLYFSDETVARDIQLFKENAHGDSHQILNLASNTSKHVHYDRGDFNSSIDRKIIPTATLNPENWRFVISRSSAPNLLTGDLAITLVVRIQ